MTRTNNISLNLNNSFNYDDNIDIIKILTLYKFSYDDKITNFIEHIINYLKAYLDFMDLRVVFTMNLLKLLTDDEIKSFQKELELLKISLIDIDYCSNYKNNIVEKVTIDNDLCVF